MTEADLPDSPESPVVARNRLAAALRKHREARGLTATSVAKDLGVSTSTVTRRERAEVDDFDPRSIKEHLDVLGVDDEQQRDALLALAEAGRESAWWDRYRDKLSSPYLRYIGLEAGAAKLWGCEPDLIPPLLQVEDYARAAIPSRYPHLVQPRSELLDRHINVLRRRQQRIIEDHSANVWFLVDETALHRPPVGLGPDQMRRQLEHLHDLAKRPHIVVQIIPWSAGIHAAVSPFIVLRFQNPEDPEIGFMETVLGAELLTRREEVELLEEAWGRLLGIACPRAESLHMFEDPGRPACCPDKPACC